MSRPETQVPPTAVTVDPVTVPRSLTPARLALGRVGSGLPTRAALDFAVAHAEARDAVHATLDATALDAAVRSLGLETITVESAAPDRATYLRRPDFGRRLSREARTAMAARPRMPSDVMLVVGDGLSAKAVDANAAPVLAALVPLLLARGLRLGPVVLATQARVAIGDEIGATLGARLVVVLIGERPGLSSTDAIGAYLTWAPRPGRLDSERNCVSNIRPAGLPIIAAAGQIAALAAAARSLGETGVRLKPPDDFATLSIG